MRGEGCEVFFELAKGLAWSERRSRWGWRETARWFSPHAFHTSPLSRNSDFLRVIARRPAPAALGCRGGMADWLW